ncbi:MAG: bifunctional oligoribonuclease/PAP phosphatase NrnA [Acidobacteriota bacterium]
MSTSKVPERLIRRLRSCHHLLLTSHANPDGDAIGSTLAAARLLRHQGKATAVWLRDPVPRIYRALPGSAKIHIGEEPPAKFPDLYDAVLVMECPSPDRTGLEKHLSGLPLINIDHHLGNELYGNVNWVDTAAPAVGEMVFRLARAMKLPIDVDTANALYLTLVTDTGGFRFSNTTAAAFDAAGDLVREGASPETISKWLYESQPESVLRLVGEMLQTLEIHDEGRVATAWMTREMAQRANAQPGDAEGLIDYPRSIEGVETVAMFKEVDDDGQYKVSLRSRGDVNVERVARRFGGGGHQNAAGFSSTQARQALYDETVEALAAEIRRNR